MVFVSGNQSNKRWLLYWKKKRSFLYSCSVYSCHLFLISSASVRSIQFLSFIVSIFTWAWNGPLVSLNFLEELSSLSHSIDFFYFFALITEKGFLISPCILWNSAFRWVYLSFSPFPLCLFSAIFKPHLDYHFAFLHFFFLEMVLITASYTMSRTSVHKFKNRVHHEKCWAGRSTSCNQDC